MHYVVGLLQIHLRILRQLNTIYPAVSVAEMLVWVVSEIGHLGDLPRLIPLAVPSAPPSCNLAVSFICIDAVAILDIIFMDIAIAISALA